LSIWIINIERGGIPVRTLNIRICVNALLFCGKAAPIYP